MTVKRLLSIDGGGIRGIIAAEILCKIEDTLKKHNSKKYHCLSDYFDFISGTSTGSILATGLATGMSAYELLEIYKDKGKEIFTKDQHNWKQFLNSLDSQNWLRKVPGWLIPSKEKLLGELLNQYTAKNLEEELQKTFIDAKGQQLTLGSSELKTNLMVVTKNVTTGKPCFFVNNTKREPYQPIKKNPYLEFETDPTIPLWDIVRASSAAPTFFPPHSFEVNGKPYEFIDGGVSEFNNSSFQLFLMSVLPEFGLSWDSGPDKILLVSIGTGFSTSAIPFNQASNYNNLNWAKFTISDLMEDANLEQNLILKLISEQRSKGHSTEKKQDNILFDKKLLSYCRFTTSFEGWRFNQLKKYGLPNNLDPNKVKGMDCVDQIEELSQIGKAVAEEQFDLQLFDGFLDKEQAKSETMV